MADFIAKTRTNYFHVTSEKTLKDILSSAHTDDNRTIYVYNDGDEYAFAVESSIRGFPEPDTDPDEDICDREAFYNALMTAVAPGDAIIITEITSTDIRELTAETTVITSEMITTIDLLKRATDVARKMLGKHTWKPRLTR